jgi:hypothetical protein
MYTPLDTVYILSSTFFVYVKTRELFEVIELGGTPCICPPVILLGSVGRVYGGTLLDFDHFRNCLMCSSITGRCSTAFKPEATSESNALLKHTAY